MSRYKVQVYSRVEKGRCYKTSPFLLYDCLYNMHQKICSFQCTTSHIIDQAKMRWLVKFQIRHV